MAESPPSSQKFDPDHKHNKDEARSHEIPLVAEAPTAVLEEGSLDPVYEAKAKVLNKAIQDIGMGKYQWQVSIHTISLASHLHTIYLHGYFCPRDQLFLNTRPGF
jgi:hypothetical protein